MTKGTIMATPTELWAVTEIAHPGLRDSTEDCIECIALAPHAVRIAKPMGSATSNFSNEPDGHAVTVTRSLAFLQSGPESTRLQLTAQRSL